MKKKLKDLLMTVRINLVVLQQEIILFFRPRINRQAKKDVEEYKKSKNENNNNNGM